MQRFVSHCILLDTFSSGFKIL